MKYAIIDISSSSVSLLIAEGEKTFEVLLRERESVAVLHYVENGKLSERGLEKIAESLSRMKELCRKTGVDECYVISTASMRNFDNFEEAATQLKVRAGVTVNFLDGEEEAYCDLVANERYKALDRAILVDVGGGSIELCDLTKEGAEALTYLDFGPIQLNRKFVKNVHPDEEEAKKIRDYVKKKLEKTELSGRNAFSTAVLVGVTNRAVYEVYRDYYDLSSEDEKRVEYDKLKKLCKHLVRSSDRSMLVLKNAPEKMYTLTTAAVALRALLKYFGVSNVCVSDFGVKEGYLTLLSAGERQGIKSDLSETGNFATREKIGKSASAKSSAKPKSKKPTAGKTTEQKESSEKKPVRRRAAKTPSVSGEPSFAASSAPVEGEKPGSEDGKSEK